MCCNMNIQSVYIYIYVHTHTYIYIYIHTAVYAFGLRNKKMHTSFKRRYQTRSPKNDLRGIDFVLRDDLEKVHTLW